MFEQKEDKVEKSSSCILPSLFKGLPSDISFGNEINFLTATGITVFMVLRSDDASLEIMDFIHQQLEKGDPHRHVTWEYKRFVKQSARTTTSKPGDSSTSTVSRSAKDDLSFLFNPFEHMDKICKPYSYLDLMQELNKPHTFKSLTEMKTHFTSRALMCLRMIVGGETQFVVRKNKKSRIVVVSAYKMGKLYHGGFTAKIVSDGEEKKVTLKYYEMMLSVNGLCYTECVQIPYHPWETLSKSEKHDDVIDLCRNGEAMNFFQRSNVRKLEKYDMDKIQAILTHIREVWAAGDDAVYQFILKTLAWQSQHPRIKTGVCFVFHGEEGAGKSCLIDDFLSPFVWGKETQEYPRLRAF
uniref:Uncharacterized protein n=1 Tax=Pithovirus LCPAC304 TaxID=2506594 RepID=A0A481Z8A8_9VIRU|nr:MAG: hypothetical protein LCPAC304_04610 [Pithovirus LCPAC304]